MEPTSSPSDPAAMVSPVLLIDDQDFVASVLRRFLSDEPDFVLHHCMDPTAAVATATHLKPVVILQDLVLPHVDGLSIVAEFRATPATKEIPIIVLSSKEDPRTKSLAFSLGANDYMVKLPDKLEVVARIRCHAKSYHNQLQRDHAYNELRAREEQLMESNAALRTTNRKLGEALAQVRELRGLLPICSYCKRVRTSEKYWKQIEEYLMEHSDVQVSHGVCEECAQAQFGELGRPPE